MQQKCIIIGASHVAAQLAPTLRQKGWIGSITVIGSEYTLPYHRPPLSKAFLAGGKNLEEILIRKRANYEAVGVRFMLGTTVASIDREAKRVILDDGESLSYSKLVLATGSHVRKLKVPGAELKGVHYLRTSADVEKIRTYISAGKKAVIIGGGYIGLETAAVLTKQGMTVTVLEAASRVLERITTPELSAFYTRVHQEEGVNIVTGAMAERLTGENSVEQVVCKDGQRFVADLVIIGVGILPAIELAETAGLTVDNGIRVDEYACTSDPDILAAGDCTNHYNSIYKRYIRLESVQNATDQATAAANTLCGQPQSYRALPWFWSDQYDIKLQIAGLSQGFDEVVMRGDMSQGRSFAAFYLQQGKVLAVDAVNKPQEFMIGKRLITDGQLVNKEKLADESVQIKTLLE